MPSGEQLEDFVLRAVGVLVLVHVDVVEEVLVKLEQLVGACQQVNHVHEQVVEVHRVGAAERTLVEVVDGRDMPLAGRSCALGVLFGHDKIVLCAGNG